MNVRKPTDYTTLFAALDVLMAANLPQMELYCDIGQLVSGKPEKGAAVVKRAALGSCFPVESATASILEVGHSQARYTLAKCGNNCAEKMM